jgi:hypothetical protein
MFFRVGRSGGVVCVEILLVCALCPGFVVGVCVAAARGLVQTPDLCAAVSS